MATPIKRIEKDFLLKVLYDEETPLMLKFLRREYVLFVTEIQKFILKCRSNEIIEGLKIGSRLELLFDYRGQTVTFATRIKEFNGTNLDLEVPEFLYKNLDRQYSRVPAPSDLLVSFAFHGDRYRLSFPKTEEYFPLNDIDYSSNFNMNNIKELLGQLSSWATTEAGNHKLVMFKDKPIESVEEKLISQSARAFYIPYTTGDFPTGDEYADIPIITEGYFRHYLEKQGTDPVFVDDSIARFLEKKRKTGIYSELWIPIPFHEYIIGYIHLWTSDSDRIGITRETIDTGFQFAKVIAASLQLNGYFKGQEVEKKFYQGQCIDLSASGMLFSYPIGIMTSSLLQDSLIDVQLHTGKRLVKTAAKIVRRYTDAKHMYFGCRFTDIAPEDLRFLFEFIYGKQFTDSQTPDDLNSGY